jgi:hypothetical protein
MTVNFPDTGELVEQLLAMFDAAAETRTEDRHPAPEVAAELLAGHYPIFGVSTEDFVDTAFDLWERVRVTEATIARYDDTAGERWAPERTARAIEQVRENALADLTFWVARHLGQPARPVLS